jgi:ankyrin repeat protein
VEVVDDDGLQPFHLALYQEDVGRPVRPRAPIGRQALPSITRVNDDLRQVVELLLEQGQDANAWGGGLTAAHIVAETGQPELAHLLIKTHGLHRRGPYCHSASPHSSYIGNPYKWQQMTVQNDGTALV